jgi:hypothetical protein
MPKNDISMFVMCVCPTKSRMCDFHQYFIGSKIIFVRRRFDNFTLLGAFVDGEIDAHDQTGGREEEEEEEEEEEGVKSELQPQG